MKRKALIAFMGLCLSLTMGLSITACGKQENTVTEETIPATVESTQTETIEEIKETTETTETTDDTVVSGDNASTSETTTSTETDYPDSRSDHQKAWDDYKESWDDFSVYGTATKGKTENDFPYYGPTGYDVTLLEERTTDKGYTVMYDTNTGKVYYSGMMLPTGSIWDDTESGGVLATYAYAKGYNSGYDVTYSEMQEVLGVYNGD